MRAQVFTDIYEANAWNGTVTRAGPGSTMGATERLAVELRDLVHYIGVTSVLDAGCSECFWQPELPGYIGVDIVPAAIERAQASYPDRRFLVADICEDELPQVELVLCRDALQHMNLADGMAAIANFRRTGAWLLLAGSFEQGMNRNIPTGGYYEPDLSSPPFSLGEPLVALDDGYWDDGERWPGKYLMGFKL